LANSISVKGVHAAYGAVRVLEEVTLKVAGGDTVVLLGTNGNATGELITPLGEAWEDLEAEVEIAVDLHSCPWPKGSEQQVLFHREAWEQPPTLRHHRDLEINDLLGREPHETMVDAVNFCHDPTGVRPDDAHDAFHERGLASGGEQQMLALARALMSAPRILLVDEPSVGLAPVLVSRTIDKIKELKESYQLTVLIAEQNFAQALRIADRGYVMVHRKIVFEGRSVDELNNNDLIRQFYLGL
jgi:branched-chain amino acid transport system ATP-binding protein